METPPDRSPSVACDWGAPPWRVDVAPPRAPWPSHVEVAVIGGGFTGLAAALALASRHVGVHVFDRAVLGAGASGRTGGLALQGTAAGPLPGTDAVLATLRATLDAHAIDCDLALGECWTVRHVAAGIAPGCGPSWPDGDRSRIAVDGSEPGGVLDPGKLVAGLARAAMAAGAFVHEHADLTAIESGAPVGLRIGGYPRVAAERVVLACNAFLPSFAPDAGIRPALTLAVATAPLLAEARAAIALGPTPFYTLDLPYLWGRATRDGRLVFGAGLAFDPGDRIERVALARGDVRDALASLVARVRGLHPALADVEMPYAWGGPIAFRRGGVPLCAELAQGVLAVGAFAGHGVALSITAGEIAACWATGAGAPPAWDASGR